MLLLKVTYLSWTSIRLVLYLKTRARMKTTSISMAKIKTTTTTVVTVIVVGRIDASMGAVVVETEFETTMSSEPVIVVIGIVVRIIDAFVGVVVDFEASEPVIVVVEKLRVLVVIHFPTFEESFITEINTSALHYS